MRLQTISDNLDLEGYIKGPKSLACFVSDDEFDAVSKFHSAMTAGDLGDSGSTFLASELMQKVSGEQKQLLNELRLFGIGSSNHRSRGYLGGFDYTPIDRSDCCATWTALGRDPESKQDPLTGHWWLRSYEVENA
ncbi:MAG: hypothetical protein ACWGQW_20960, partial [bacterium]